MPGDDCCDGDGGFVGIAWWQDASEYVVRCDLPDHQGTGEELGFCQSRSREVPGMLAALVQRRRPRMAGVDLSHL
jgi:hypothetical protein